MESLRSKVALVTGGSGGIGRAIARDFARQGIDVALGFHTKQLPAREFAKALSDEYGVRAIAVGGDLSDPSSVDQVVKTAEQQLGDVQILVNNAGINPGASIADISPEDWSRTISANLTSAFLVTQRVLPSMRKRQFGRVVMMSSVAAQLGGVIGPHYAASKAGMIGLMHSYASLLASEGITVNAIAPALIRTDMIAGKPQITPTILPVGRFGEPDEVASMVSAVVANGYMTGQTLNINGGWYQS